MNLKKMYKEKLEAYLIKKFGGEKDDIINDPVGKSLQSETKKGNMAATMALIMRPTVFGDDIYIKNIKVKASNSDNVRQKLEDGVINFFIRNGYQYNKFGKGTEQFVKQKNKMYFTLTFFPNHQNKKPSSGYMTGDLRISMSFRTKS